VRRLLPLVVFVLACEAPPPTTTTTPTPETGPFSIGPEVVCADPYDGWDRWTEVGEGHRG